jgi:hypothetical protein
MRDEQDRSDGRWPSILAELTPDTPANDLRNRTMVVRYLPGERQKR